MTIFQKTLLASIVTLALAFGVTLFYGSEADQRAAVERLCETGLEDLAAIAEVTLCSHGPDPRSHFIDSDDGYSEMDVARAYDVPEVEPVANRKLCPGNGRRGPRIFTWYVGGDLTTETKRAIRRVLGETQALIETAHPDLTQKLRFRCWKDRKPAVKYGEGIKANGKSWACCYHPSGTNPPGWDDDIVKRYRAVDRVTLVFFDTEDFTACGTGSIQQDDRDSPDNRNARGPATSSIGPRCWHAYTVLHELMHNFGAVQDSAPHSSQATHCYDQHDNQCYNDGGTYYRSGGGPLVSCPRPRRIDCNGDDYYNPAPVPGSYLDAHWNAADSSFLTPPRRKS